MAILLKKKSRVRFLNRVLQGLFITLTLAMAGCGTPSGPIDLADSSYRSPNIAKSHDPWGSLAVRFVRDSRPGWELGFHNYLNDSYYSDELFEFPVPAVLKRLILEESQRAGTFEPRAEDEKSNYLAEIDLKHFYVRTQRNLLDLIPILPTTTVEAVIDFEVRLVDHDGRLFMKKRYNSKDKARRDQLADVGGSGTDRLLEILSVFMGELVVDMDMSVIRFWSELGMSVPKPSLLPKP